MLGGKELERLAVAKEALLVESGLNRLELQAEYQNLRKATAWVGTLARGSREHAPVLLLLAPVAGFLLARVSTRLGDWFNRVAPSVRWITGLYSWWKTFSASRKASEAGEPAA